MLESNCISRTHHDEETLGMIINSFLRHNYDAAETVGLSIAL